MISSESCVPVMTCR